MSLLTILTLGSIWGDISQYGWVGVWNKNILKDLLMLLACFLYALDYFFWRKTGQGIKSFHIIIAVLLLFGPTIARYIL